MHFFNAVASKSKEKDAKLLFMKSSYIFHIIVLKKKPINNNDCLMLVLQQEETKIAANSQGKASTE